MTLPVSPSRTFSPSNIVPKPVGNIVHFLMKLNAHNWSKNVLYGIDFNAMKLEQADFLTLCYNDDIIFEFPPLGVHGQISKAKHLCGMDRRYDGHAWSRTITSYIGNDLNLLFCMSSCLGHLHCDNVKCEYLKRDHRTAGVNETEWEKLSKKVFEIGSTSS